MATLYPINLKKLLMLALGSFSRNLAQANPSNQANSAKCSKLCQTIHSPVTGKNLLRKEAHWIDGTPCWKEEQ